LTTLIGRQPTVSRSAGIKAAGLLEECALKTTMSG